MKRRIHGLAGTVFIRAWVIALLALAQPVFALLPPAEVECCQRKDFESERCRAFTLTAERCEKTMANWADTYRRMAAMQQPPRGPAAALDRVLTDAYRRGFSGVVMLGDESRVLLTKQGGLADRENNISLEYTMPWRWASTSKQVTAIIVAQLVAEGKLSLDKPVSDYLSAAQFPSVNAKQITIRHLLTHTSGITKPTHADGTVTGEVLPDFYLAKLAAGSVHANATRGLCAGKARHVPGEKFDYNNCDYLVLGAVIEQVTGKPFAEVLSARITRPLKLESVVLAGENESSAAVVKGYVDASRPEAAFNLATFGASGALVGTPADLLALDRALMGDSLLSADMKRQWWAGDVKLGYAALGGVWAFPATLRGCKEPIDIVERRGSIGGVQVRNFIAPALKRAMVVFSNRGDWEFGEAWKGEGFSFEVLSAGLCG